MEIILSIVSAVFAAGGAYAAVRVELRYLGRDVAELRRRVDHLADAQARALRIASARR